MKLLAALAVAALALASRAAPCADGLAAAGDQDPAAGRRPGAQREYVVGLPSTHRLFSAYSGVYGKHEGFAVRAVQAVCAELGFKCRLVYASYRELDYLVSSGKVDFAAGFFAAGGRYGFNFRMTSHLIKAHPVVVSLNSDIPFASADMLAGLNYGVRFGTDEQRVLDEARSVRKIAYYTVYGSYDEMFEALSKGRVDALFIDNLTAFGMMSWVSEDCYLAPDRLGIYPPGAVDGFVLATSRSAGLQRALDAAVGRLRANGTFNSIALNYFPFQADGL
ncbi:MAG: substrate-binding periplasmic protein [Succinivibrio sp.]